jgi:hypothetical protein
MIASMGPRLCSRGNSSDFPIEMEVDMLQWGHDFVVVETERWIA